MLCNFRLFRLRRRPVVRRPLSSLAVVVVHPPLFVASSAACLPRLAGYWPLAQQHHHRHRHCVLILPPPSLVARTGALPQLSKRPAKLMNLSLLFSLLLPWQPLGQYGASSCPMAAFSGFRCNPGHATLDDVLRIPPAHCVYQNGQQTRCFVSCR